MIFHNGGCQKVMNADDGTGLVMITSGVRCSVIMFSKAVIARMTAAISAILLALGLSCRRIRTGCNGKRCNSFHAECLGNSSQIWCWDLS